MEAAATVEATEAAATVAATEAAATVEVTAAKLAPATRAGRSRCNRHHTCRWRTQTLDRRHRSRRQSRRCSCLGTVMEAIAAVAAKGVRVVESDR